MFRALYCLIAGHTDVHVRNLSAAQSAPLREVSEWHCSTCKRKIRHAGWVPEPPAQVAVDTLAADVPELDAKNPPPEVSVS